MERKVFTYRDLISMPKDQFYCFKLAMETKAYRLLGVPWKKWVRVHEDLLRREIVFEYE